MGRKLTLVAVSLPLVVIALGIVRAEWFLSQASSYVFEIEGFDPRDLLRGHYLQFRLRTEITGAREPCDPAVQQCCVCLEGAAGNRITRVETLTCESARSQCAASLEQSFITAAQRFYVPEAKAQQLEQRLREAMTEHDAEAVLAVDRHGSAVVTQLRVKGAPLE